MSSGMKERLCRSLEKVLHAETRELPAAAGGILLFFLLFLAYSMLRPVRETMGIAGGVQSLQWLFTANFPPSLRGPETGVHRGPVFIWMGFLKGAEKGHSSVDVRFFHS